MKGLKEHLNVTKTPMAFASAERGLLVPPSLLLPFPHHPESRACPARGLAVLVLTAAPTGDHKVLFVLARSRKRANFAFKCLFIIILKQLPSCM